MLALVPAGCDARKQPIYQDSQGFRFTAPPGWVERVRGESMPAGPSHRNSDVPLPPLGVPGTRTERLLVRYDRVLAGHHAWLRVTVADVPSSTPLKACLSTRLPARGWKRESQAENLDVGGLPAARIAFVGRWHDQDYLCETVAVRKEDNVYLISASFPASDSTAREQVRQAVAGAAWQ